VPRLSLLSRVLSERSPANTVSALDTDRENARLRRSVSAVAPDLIPAQSQRAVLTAAPAQHGVDRVIRNCVRLRVLEQPANFPHFDRLCGI